jgi:hypothetical protein
VKIFEVDPEEARRQLEIELAEAGVDFIPTVPEAIAIIEAREGVEEFAEGVVPEPKLETIEATELEEGDLHMILRREPEK